MVAINGFSVGQRNAIGIKTYKVPGTEVLLPVRSEVAPLMIGLARELHQRVEPLREGWCWGYAFRKVRGGTTPSFHSAGIAIDLNAPEHPLGVRGTFSSAQASVCRALARKYGCRWGGDYRRRADEMHFEIIVPRHEALRRVSVLDPDAPVPPPPGPSDRPAYPGTVLRRGDMNNPHVRLWQERMQERGWRISVDGHFGPQTERVVEKFQREKGLAVDGLIGPNTWEAAWTEPVT